MIVEKLPLIDHNSEVAEHVSKTAIRIRMPFRPEYMGQDIWQDSGHGVFSGPKVMGLADTSMYVCMHAALGKDVVAVLSNLVITFLRPALAKDLIAEAKIIRIGRRLAYLETYLFSDGSTDPVAHATSSFAYRFAPATPGSKVQVRPRAHTPTSTAVMTQQPIYRDGSA